MNTLSEQVLNFLVIPPGNLVYHLVLVLSVAASLQALLITSPFHHHYPFHNFEYSRRTLLAFYLLLGGQAILFIVSLLSWAGVLDSRMVLPPLERAVTMASLIVITWVWAYERRDRQGDTYAFGALIIALIFFIISVLVWTGESEVYTFNFTTLEMAWTVITLFTALAGIAVITHRHPANWIYGIIILGLIFLGNLVHLFWGSFDVDFAGPVRLAQLFAYPLLPILVQRFLSSPDGMAEAGYLSLPGSPRYTSDPLTILSWLQSIFSDKAVPVVSKAIAQTMGVDICYLISDPSTSGTLKIIAGYDQNHGQDLPGLELDKTAVPQLAEALRQGQAVILEGSTPDLQTINSNTGLNAPSLLMVPLKDRQALWGAALLMDPFTHRDWEARDQNYLENISEYIVRLLQKADQPESSVIPETAMGLSVQNTLASEDQIQPKEGPGLEEQLTLATQQQVTQSREAEATISRLQQEILDLQDELETRDTPPGLMDMAEEARPDLAARMRNPIISTQGYTELLLSETIGILGSLQTSVLERIRSSMLFLRNQLDRDKNIPSEMLFTFLTANTADIIDEALADTSPLRREKHINLRVDLPDILPQVHVDREIMRQILVELLQNAGVITPPKGTIGLQIRQETQGENLPFFIIQVTDSGGGISLKDIPGLFSRDKKPLLSRIKGVGSQTYLQNANTLVETYDGKITVVCERGRSTTYTVSLPLSATTPSHRLPNDL